MVGNPANPFALQLATPAPNVKTTVTTVHKYDLQINAEMIRQAFNLPDDARVYFTVPSGGGWSNSDIDIEAEHPVFVEWTRTEIVDK